MKRQCKLGLEVVSEPVNNFVRGHILHLVRCDSAHANFTPYVTSLGMFLGVQSVSLNSK